MEISGHKNSVPVIYAEPATIKCPVVIFAEREAVANPVIAKFGERHDVGTIHNTLPEGVNNLEAAKRATMFIDRDNYPPKCSVSYDEFFFVRQVFRAVHDPSLFL